MTRSKQDRREIPCGTGFHPDRTTGPSLVETRTPWDAHRYPINEYDALMRCDFMEEPDPIYDGDLWERVDAVLTPKEAAVIDYIVVGGMSLAQAGKRLGADFPRNGLPLPYSKEGVSKLKRSALVKLRNMFEGDTDE